MKNINTVINTKYIGNSVSIDNRDVAIIENDYGNNKKAKRLEEDALSNNSLGSHQHRKLKSDSGSHKGSTETVDDGEEKRDASKEDFDDGMRLDGTLTSTLSSFFVTYSSDLRTEGEGYMHTYTLTRTYTHTTYTYTYTHTHASRFVWCVGVGCRGGG
ncbi:hypothetical protein E2C01_075836 [Portunus trituberculatus]|uniref:Uncharacterized protein n=1 Tax=Portunus trituberculatus TaxID=210409 RepID=A0A5B7IHD1_PORTR|nr:hypothetical protein [Portunus trituberculatus]